MECFVKKGFKIFSAIGLLGCICAPATFADISVSVDAGAGVKKISPYIYGRNIDVIGDAVESDAEKAAELLKNEQAFYTQVLESGIHMMRANNGNNATRYNWRKKLTVHPDWYNNVYSHDWDITAKKILENLPGVDAQYAFQLTGYAASTTDYNFEDWTFYTTHNETWAKQTLDLAGGGEVSEDGQTLVKAGDHSLYNEAWPADSTVGIIAHWKDELKYDMSRFRYWSMDNEMEIWNGTHADLPLDSGGAFLVKQYIDVAKKARAAWPDIKLTGPVTANEWQWCNIAGKTPDKKCWLEYFIEQVAAEQKASGIRLLDVFDLHWYPTEKDYGSMVNWHRVFFDTTYNYPGANGIKTLNGGWDEKITKEYIFKRVNDWLDKYFGEGHGITLALTETDFTRGGAMTSALVYASWLGTFMDNGVEIFTPWTWGDGMYETVHLFSRYGHEFRVQSMSDNDSLVSAYSSVNASGDSLTVIFVNRAESEAQNVNLKLENFKAIDGTVPTFTLEKLSGETFKSHTENALQAGTANVASNALALTLPANSITAVLLTTDAPKSSVPTKMARANGCLLYGVNGEWFVDNSRNDIREISVLNALGQNVILIQNAPAGTLQLATEKLNPGNYFVQIKTFAGTQGERIFLR